MFRQLRPDDFAPLRRHVHEDIRSPWSARTLTGSAVARESALRAWSRWSAHGPCSPDAARAQVGLCQAGRDRVATARQMLRILRRPDSGPGTAMLRMAAGPVDARHCLLVVCRSRVTPAARPAVRGGGGGYDSCMADGTEARGSGLISADEMLRWRDGQLARTARMVSTGVRGFPTSAARASQRFAPRRIRRHRNAQLLSLYGACRSGGFTMWVMLPVVREARARAPRGRAWAAARRLDVERVRRQSA